MRFVAWFPALLVTALSFGTSIDTLAEAYGAGPPYYGRTTNLDKWVSPWPVVLLLVAASAGTLVLTHWALRKRPTAANLYR
jgi:hypothetical protein